MHRRMSVQYGNSVVSQQIVCEWIERFKNGRTSVKHGEGTGRQSTSITDADAERVYWHDPKLSFEVMEHPPCRLYLTPSDSRVWST
jgi:hypothetical protein